VNKRRIIIAAAAGLVSFTGAFATGWLTKPTAAMGSSASAQTGDANQTQPLDPMPSGIFASALTLAADGTTDRILTEQQLKELIYEVREKIREYNRKLQDLEKEKERLQVAQQTLKKDIDALGDLRVELAAKVADLKNEREALRKTRVEIEQVEKTNLVAIAAAYDKMDAVGASEILLHMATGQPKTGAGNFPGPNIDDAVKILYYMQERTKAKVLAEIVTTEPALAALLSQKLKLVREGT